MGRAIAVLGFVLIAAAWGYGSAVIFDGLGAEPLVAALSAVVPVAAFAWCRRRCDALEFVLPAILIAYAAYLGIALARVPSISMMTIWTIGALADKWPVVLVAGLPFALILTVAIAMPIYSIPVRRRSDPRTDEALWAFFRGRDGISDDGTSPSRASG